MKIQDKGYPLPISNELVEIFNKEIHKSGKNNNVALYINFRDPTYSQEDGGFHPVEVMISKTGYIQYITDFSYMGYPPELVKEIDFDIAAGIFQHFRNEYNITRGVSLFKLWQLNFCSYYNMDAYKIKIMEVL